LFLIPESCERLVIISFLFRSQGQNLIVQKSQRLLYFQSHIDELVFNRDGLLDVLFFKALDTRFNSLGYMRICYCQSLYSFQENVVNQVSADSKGDISK